MRVVAGTLRGRRLVAPAGDHVRPTSDRVREAVFNALQSLVHLPGARVLDLFAGTGAMAIEALSRGAEWAVLVEHDRRAQAVIRTNLDALGLNQQAQVVAADAVTWLRRRADDEPFDVALVDPPYRFDRWEQLLAELPAEVAVLESDREIVPPPGWMVPKVRRYGGTVVTFCRRTTAGEDDPT